MKCRHCNTELEHIFVDLVNCPPSNDMVRKEKLNEPEPFYPLKIFVCLNCFLVQVDEMKKADKIFDSEYTYFSSYSKSWLEHSKNYVDMIINRLKLNKESFVIEIASNDGYLLNYFNIKEIPCLGIEPSSSTAAVARENSCLPIPATEYVASEGRLFLMNKKSLRDPPIPPLTPITKLK